MGSKRGYPSDLTDEQWAVIEPLLPAPRRGGRPEKHERCRIVDAILYLGRTGCSWRQLPHDFPPCQTVDWYFTQRRAGGTVDRIYERLRAAVRDAAGRDPTASAGIVDAQSVKGADTVGAATRGFDAGKKTNGRKRHIVVDILRRYHLTDEGACRSCGTPVPGVYDGPAGRWGTRRLPVASADAW